MVDLCWLLASQNSAAVLKVEATANHMLNFWMQELGSNVKTRSKCVHVSQERNNPWNWPTHGDSSSSNGQKSGTLSGETLQVGSTAGRDPSNTVVWNDVFVTAGSKCATATATWGAPRCTQWSCMFVWQVRINKHNKHTGTTWYYQIYPNLPISAAFHFSPASVQVPIDMALLKRSPAWSFGLNRKGHPSSGFHWGPDFFQLFHIVETLRYVINFHHIFLVFCLPFFHIFHIFHVTRQASPDPKPRISESFATQWTLTGRSSSKCRGLAARTARIFKQMRSFKNIFSREIYYTYIYIHMYIYMYVYVYIYIILYVYI